MLGIENAQQPNVDWILLPGGTKAMYRKPAEAMLPGTRLATIEELFLANQGYEFPWGRSPDASRASRLWMPAGSS